MSSSFRNIPDNGSASWQDPVATFSSLPLNGNSDGDARVTLDTDTIYIWNAPGSAWIPISGGGGGAVSAILGGTNISASSPTGNVTVSYTGQWKNPVANMAALPGSGNTSGDVRVTLDTGIIWEWTGSSWIAPLEGAPAWGSITGTLSNQTDLQSALNAKQNTLTIGNLTDSGTDGIIIGNGSGSVIGSGTTIAQHVADTTHNGYLSSTDWNTFNSKLPALSAISPLLINSGSISILQSGVSSSGYLSSTDWNTFNNKQASGSYLTALTGDGSATGPGSATLTLATVNSSPGTFGSASSSAIATVNGKGLITSLSVASIQIAESQVNNLVSDLAGKQPTGNYITALTGDGTASGPGSASLTLATVNSSPGSFGSVSSSVVATVNAKGLITSLSVASIQIAETQVTNLVSDLAGKQPTGNYITALTGDVTASGPGSVASTIAANAVTNSKLAQAPALTLKGNSTSSLANIQDLTVVQVNTMLTQAEFNIGNSGSSFTVSWLNGPAQLVTMSSNSSVSFINGLSGAAYVIRVVQGASAFTLHWSGVKWPGGTAPVISVGSGAIDLVNLYYDGTNYYGSFAQAFS